jgi:hypothetical protein
MSAKEKLQMMLDGKVPFNYAEYERLWQKSKTESVAEIQKNLEVARSVQENLEVASKVFSLHPMEVKAEAKSLPLNTRVEVMTETLNFLQTKFPNTLTVKSLKYLQTDKNLLSELLEHLRQKGLLIL